MGKYRATAVGALWFALAFAGAPALPAWAGNHGAPHYSEIARGRYLVKAGDCAYCHTADNGKPFAGGRAVPTPFGIIYSTNITPDKDTGIGRWSEADLYRAMHSGIDRRGNHLYPAFPYPWYTEVTPDDVKAIHAYLATVEPVRKHDRPPELSWPFSMRSLMAVWNKLYFDEGTFTGNPRKSAQWNRGAYLVEGLGHCGACHTPKNFAGATKASDAFEGGYGEHAFAPSLAGGLRDGLGGWTAGEIVEYLKTGSNAKSSAAGPMADEVLHSTQYLSDQDLAAMAAYLKGLPNNESKAPDAATGQLVTLGRDVYADDCSGCHLRSGEGQPGVFPPLKGSSAIQAAKADTLVRIVLDGAQVPPTASKPTGLEMPSFAEKLDDRQVAAVVSFIRNAWGNRAATVSQGEVARMRSQMHQEGGGP